MTFFFFCSWKKKGQAEKAVREAFPKATIIRSATILGREDRILNKFGALTQDFPFTPLLFPKDSMIQPINVCGLKQKLFVHILIRSTR